MKNAINLNSRDRSEINDLMREIEMIWRNFEFTTNDVNYNAEELGIKHPSDFEISHKVLPGLLGLDGKGRFFVMEVSQEYAIKSYESGVVNDYDGVEYLEKKMILWPFSKYKNAQSIREGLREYGLSNSENIFFDHDRLISVEKKQGDKHALFRIKYSAQHRSKILAMRREIPLELSTDAFPFSTPPDFPSYSSDQIRFANNKVAKADGICLGITAIIVTTLLVFFSIYIMPEGVNYENFKARPVKFVIFYPLLLILLFLGSCLLILPMLIYMGINALVEFLYSKTIIKNEVKVYNDLQNHKYKWKKFIEEEIARYDAWEREYVKPCQEYRKVLIAYAFMRAASPWSFDIFRIWNLLKAKYPNEIPLGEIPLEPWQEAILQARAKLKKGEKGFWICEPSFLKLDQT